jgi:Tfp pilus assembly pilus retraction ATPase PilT
MAEVKGLRIENLLEEVVKVDASDLHLTVGSAPMLRVDGFLRPVEGISPLSEDEVEKLIFSVVDDVQKDILVNKKCSIEKSVTLYTLYERQLTVILPEFILRSA